MNPPNPSVGNAAVARGTVVLLLVLNAIVQAQDTPRPEPPAAPAPAVSQESAQSEMLKWIKTTDEGWQATFKRDVTDAHENELKKLKLRYLNLLDEAVAKASKASDLDGAVALRNEQKRFSGTEFFPEQDEVNDPVLVKQIRATLHALLVQAENNRTARANALFAKYDLLLADAQTQLTKIQRLEDALLVKAKREEVAAAWGTSAVGNSSQTTPPATIVQKIPANPTHSPMPVRVPTVSGAVGAKADSSQSPNVSGNLKERLVNTVWIWNGQETITFLPGGKAKWSGGNAPSLAWRVADNNKRVIEGTAVSGKPFRMTLDATLESGTLAVGGQAERATSRVAAK